MQQILRLIPLLSVLALAGCSGFGPSREAIGPTLAQPNPNMQAATLQPAQTLTPAQATASAQAMTDITAFVDPSVVALLSSREMAEAAGAQFNALEFGRPGAPRAWQGDRGASGQVIVGPPVNVNALYCRDFTHSVNVGGQSYVRKGMACRELDRRWSVVNAG